MKKKTKKVFDGILYANCWEYPEIDREAFKINADDTVFSISSGGCNVLTFLIDNPAKIISLDLNPHQNYLLELKITAFKFLEYDELLEFFGVRESSDRIEIYNRLKSHLSPESLDFWERHLEEINGGIIHCGRFESYMRLLGKTFRFMSSWNLINKFIEVESFSEREELYHKKWKNVRWWFFTRIFLSRLIMILLFDKAFFKYLEKKFSFGKHFEKRIEFALTKLPIKENYFLSYMLTGRFYSEAHLPPYLRRENYELIKSRVNKIEIVTMPCEVYFDKLPDNLISKFNFSNIFEWISKESFIELLNKTVRVAKNGAIMTYRNLLVTRERPEFLSDKIFQLKGLAGSLYKEDLSFIYNNYVVEQIHKD